MDDAPLPDPDAATTVTDGDPTVGTTTSGGPDRKSPWRWVPSLYFAEGLPYVVVMTLAVILYKRLGISNTDIALYTSWLYLPWVIKPFWSPVVDVIRTKRLWIVAMQVLIGGGLAGVALTIPTEPFFQYTLAFLWLLAFSSATHDIAADGFYMLALDEHDQAWYVGIRSTFYRAAVIAVSGLVPMLAGALEASTGLGAVDVPVEVVATSEEALPTPGAALPPTPVVLPVRPVSVAPQQQELPPDRSSPSQQVNLEDLDQPASPPPAAATDPPADTSGTAAPPVAPDAAPARTPALGGELRLLVENRAASVPLALRDPEEVDALIAQVREQNRAAGFYAAEDAEAAAAAADEGPSWWQRTVSGPLGRWIGAAFGEEPPEVSATAGNVGLVEFRLSGPPPEGEAVPVNFGFDDGDASVHLVEGERFTFTQANWDRPFTAVVQLDPKLREPTAATFRATSGNIPLAWSITFFVLAGVFLAITAWHQFALPRPASDRPAAGEGGGTGGILGYLVFLVCFIPVLLVLLVPMLVWGLVRPRSTGPWGRVLDALPFSDTPFARTIVTFFLKPEIGVAIAFVLFYRFAEAQLVKLAAPFLLDSVEVGGLGLTTGEVGFVYGTVGALCLTVGGILGGIVAARDGLKRWLWPMVFAINVPNAVYLLLAVFEPQNFLLINLAIGVEQFGYGFGFAAFLLYLIYVSEGESKTAHYAIGTGFMALGMMIPGMFSGWLQEIVGYERFFLWVLLATIPSFLVAARIHIDPEFGKKKEQPAG